MPSQKTNQKLSNLSVLLPRRVHRKAKAKFIRSGASSFPVWVAAVLDRAPTMDTAEQMFALFRMEAEMGESRQCTQPYLSQRQRRAANGD